MCFASDRFGVAWGATATQWAGMEPPFTLDHVDDVFNRVTFLKYSQHVILRPNLGGAAAPVALPQLGLL